MVVSATRTETTPEQAAVAANVITEQQLAALNYPMLFDALRDIPGLAIAQSGTAGSIASIFTRGSESTGTLVLLDGVPLNDPGGEINLAIFRRKASSAWRSCADPKARFSAPRPPRA